MLKDSGISDEDWINAIVDGKTVDGSTFADASRFYIVVDGRVSEISKREFIQNHHVIEFLYSVKSEANKFAIEFHKKELEKLELAVKLKKSEIEKLEVENAPYIQERPKGKGREKLGNYSI